MSIWALSDLHLCLGAPEKDMSFFGPLWKDYMDQIETHWNATVSSEDLVLIAGDISWARSLEMALLDLKWIDTLPGTKLLIKGNHDSWWPSSSKLNKVLPPSIHYIHNNTFSWNDVCIGGSRLWDSMEYNFSSFIALQDNPRAVTPPPKEEGESLFIKELDRLSTSLRQLNSNARLKIAMTHYPPIGADLAPSRASTILERHHIDLCVFGHLHSIKPNSLSFGSARGVRYLLTSVDAVNFTPVLIDF